MEAYQAYYNTNESNPANGTNGGQQMQGEDKNHYMV